MRKVQTLRKIRILSLLFQSMNGKLLLFLLRILLAGGGELCIAQLIPSNAGDVGEWLASQTSPFRIGLGARLVAAEKLMKVIRVEKGGGGDFQTVTDAVNSIPAGNRRRTVVRIGPGVYTEKVNVDRSKPFVTFYGDPNAMPTITFAGTAAQYGTWDSGSVGVDADYFMACNIIFENSAPRPTLGVKGAQAVAMRISGDKAAFYNCKFKGHQDTLLDDKGMHFFKDCFVSGTTDFIFGNGRSIYLNCELHSLAIGYGVITAQGRDTKKDKSGFSFVHCKITGTGDVFLGRAWRQSSRVVFSFTYMDAIVDPKGWDDMGFPDRHRTLYYGEYQCMGPGAALNGRVDYAKALTDKQAKPYLDLTFILASIWLLPPPPPQL